MEEVKGLLQELSKNFENPIEKQIFISLNNKRKEEKSRIELTTKTLQDSVQLFRKKNIQLEGEVRRQTYIHNKKNDAFVEVNNDKLKLAKRLVELEDENENIKMSIHEMERNIQSKEEKIRHLSRPSFNEIYLEVVKGFCVEFIEKEGGRCCRIKNKKENDIFVVDIKEGASVFKTCNAIWDKI